MLWHITGVQGSGKSWIGIILAEDYHIKEGRKVFANIFVKFGEYLDIHKLLNYEYENCIIILDEAYGIADSHSRIKANDLVSEVVMQSRKRDVEVFFITQNEGDLYKRVREQAERKILCQNIGSEKEPVLRYFITDIYGNVIDSLEFDTETVKSAYHLFDSYEKIMPVHLNSGTSFDEVLELFNDVPKKKSFCVLLNKKNPYLIRDITETIFDLMELEKYDRVKKLLKSH